MGLARAQYFHFRRGHREGRDARRQNFDLACSIDEFNTGETCNRNAEIQVLIFGDSHVVDAFNFLNAGYGHYDDINIIVTDIPVACFKSLEGPSYIKSPVEACQQNIDKLFSPDLIDNLDIIVFAALPPPLQALTSIGSQLKKANPLLKIVVYGGYIILKRDCAYYVSKTNSTDACASPENIRYFERGERKRMYAHLKGEVSYYLDRVELLCRDRIRENCLTKTEEGVPAFYDSNHTSFEFAEMSGRMYAAKHPSLFHELVERE